MRWIAALLAAGLLAGACSGDDEGGRPTPTTQPTTPRSVVDRSGIELAGVPGATTSTIVETGTARIGGTVAGPSGLIVGATVRIERLVDGREVLTEVLTGPDGRYLVEGLPGGRYRVRAFLAPTLAQLEPEVRFLEDATDHDIPLTMEDQGGIVVRADVAPSPPLLGRAVNLVAVVATRAVDVDGIVRSTPVVGVIVELTGLGRWVLRDDGAPTEDEDDDEGTTTSTTFGFFPTITTTSTTVRPAPSPAARTDESGRVRYELRCHEPGASGLSLRIPVRVPPEPDSTTTTLEPQVTMQSLALEVPACIDPATTTTLPPSTTAPPVTAIP